MSYALWYLSALCIATGASIVFLALLFCPLEAAYSARPKQGFFRPHWFTDLCFLLGQYLIFNGLVFWLLNLGAGWLDQFIPASFREGVRNQPWWLQAVEVIVLSDFCVYWGHRLQHRLPILWRFHSIHHSAQHLDWLAAHREHPLDTVYTLGLINLPVFLLGFPIETLAGLVAFRGLWAIYIHSNVRLPIGPLRMLIGAPELHHWHHDCARDAGNYANNSPLMDLLFGTYRCPAHEPEKFGIREEISETYLGQLLHPFGIRLREAGAVRHGEAKEVGSVLGYRATLPAAKIEQEPAAMKSDEEYELAGKD